MQLVALCWSAQTRSLTTPRVVCGPAVLPSFQMDWVGSITLSRFTNTPKFEKCCCPRAQDLHIGHTLEPPGQPLTLLLSGIHPGQVHRIRGGGPPGDRQSQPALPTTDLDAALSIPPRNPEERAHSMWSPFWLIPSAPLTRGPSS